MNVRPMSWNRILIIFCNKTYRKYNEFYNTFDKNKYNLVDKNNKTAKIFECDNLYLIYFEDFF